MEQTSKSAEVRNGILQAVGVIVAVALLGLVVVSAWNTIGADARAERDKQSKWLADRDAKIYAREIERLRGY